MFRNRFVLVSLLVSFVFLISLTPSCVYEVETPAPCFQDNVLPIFVSKCAYTGCHNSTSKERGYDLTTYEGIMKGVVAKKPQSSEVYTQCSTGEMPPRQYEALTKLELSLIKNWIRAGAENTSKCVTCDTSSKYASRVQPILDKWCITCHNSTLTSGNHNLSNYNGVAASIQTGRFTGSIQHSSGFSAMPQGGSKLSDCDINAIVKWINAGYPNN